MFSQKVDLQKSHLMFDLVKVERIGLEMKMEEEEMQLTTVGDGSLPPCQQSVGSSEGNVQHKLTPCTDVQSVVKPVLELLIKSQPTCCEKSETTVHEEAAIKLVKDKIMELMPPSQPITTGNCEILLETSLDSPMKSVVKPDSGPLVTSQPSSAGNSENQAKDDAPPSVAQSVLNPVSRFLSSSETTKNAGSSNSTDKVHDELAPNAAVKSSQCPMPETLPSSQRHGNLNNEIQDEHAPEPAVNQISQQLEELTFQNPFICDPNDSDLVLSHNIRLSPELINRNTVVNNNNPPNVGPVSDDSEDYSQSDVDACVNDSDSSTSSSSSDDSDDDSDDDDSDDDDSDDDDSDDVDVRQGVILPFDGDDDDTDNEF